MVVERSPAAGLAVLERLHRQGVAVAVVIADQWMPEVSGVEFLARMHELHPSARRMLLIGVLDRTVNAPMVQAMALGLRRGGQRGPGDDRQQVFVVGAGNSAGQAALHLAKYAGQVTLLVRGRSLGHTRSDYLSKEIQASGIIAVRLGTQVIGAGGVGRLEHLTLRDAQTGATEKIPAAALFILIGAQPHTGWLAGTPTPAAGDQQSWGVRRR